MTNSADADLQKPTDLDLHCLLRQGMSCSAREGLNIGTCRPDQGLSHSSSSFFNIGPDKSGFQVNIFLISPQKHVVGTH